MYLKHMQRNYATEKYVNRKNAARQNVKIQETGKA